MNPASSKPSSQQSTAPLNKQDAQPLAHSLTNQSEKPPAKHTNKWLALSITSIGTLMSTLNASSIHIANPILASEFGISMGQVQWVTTIYLIVLGSFMLLAGRIGDRIGSHRIYITGAWVFATGSLLCGFSPGFEFLLGARAVQALGGALMMATSMGLVVTLFPQKQRGRALGVTVLMVGIGNLLGPSLGGLVLSVAPWHLLFFINVPFMCITALLAALFLRSPVPKQVDAPPLDKFGALLLAGIISTLILGISGSFTGSHWFLGALILLVPLFLYVERRQKQPLLEISLLRNQRFSLGNLIAFFTYAANIMIAFQLPFFLQNLWNMPVANAGLVLMVSAIAMGLMGPVAGFLSDHLGAMRVMPIALSLIVAAFCLAFFIPAEQNVIFVIGYLALIGLGMGLLNTPNNSEIMTAAGRKFSSYASGFVGTNRNLAFCLGTGASAGLFGLFTGLFAPSFTAGDTYLLAFRCIVAVSLIFSLISLSIFLYLRRAQKAQETLGEPEKS
ncbi:MAG: MFS transporter [Coriobacteriales bacterium]|jgi:EmrB/QacA subfamily drug resistance transporter|nr:MFS transporter [Coriobacteriales bacterium]